MPINGDVRGSHLLACVDCVVDKRTKDVMLAAWEMPQRVIRYAMSLGLVVRPILNSIVPSPPLIIMRPQIDRIVGILQTSIRETVDELVRERLWRR